jgi:hypothetical protein
MGMLIQHYRDILAELSAAGAEYLVVDGFAIAAHVVPRSTFDIDVWVRPGPENARRVWNALASFGAPVDNLTADDIARPGFGYQIGVAPVRIDILTEIDGITFEEAWRDREHLNFEGVVVPFISMEHLLVNKRASGRPKDLADIALIEAEQSAQNRESSDDA